jgi:hypothetical protein
MLLGYRSLSQSNWQLPDLSTIDVGLRKDFCRRISFWQFCLDHHKIIGQERYFNKVYQDAIDRLKKHLVLDQELINSYTVQFNAMFGRIF